MWGEKEGTYTNSERRVSKVNCAVPPPGEARPDFDIFMALADVLGVRDELFPGWQKPADAFEEWKRISAGRLCDYSGMTYKSIEQHGGLQWPLPAGTAPSSEVRRLYTDGTFQTEDGRARLIPCTWEPFPEQPSSEFPFVLNTGRTVEHWHTRTKTAKVPILERLSPNAWVEMNPLDARTLRLKPQGRVDIVSRRGRVRNVELRVTETVAPGQLFVPFHYFEANANQVTQSAFDPISREPNYKQSAVRIEVAQTAFAGRDAAFSAQGSGLGAGTAVRARRFMTRFWRGSTIPSLAETTEREYRIPSVDAPRDGLSGGRRTAADSRSASPEPRKRGDR
jgi:assimilatory nitrate reductase catalytic subunit